MSDTHILDDGLDFGGYPQPPDIPPDPVGDNWRGPPGPPGPPGPGATPSDTIPVMDGTGTPGTASTAARGDHVHPSDTSRVAKAGDTMTGRLNVNPALTGTAFQGALAIASTAVGSGTNGPATAQIGLNINHSKVNYLTTSAVGEIDGIYVTARQGGPGSDVGGVLVDVGNTGSGFSAVLEGVTTQMAPTTGGTQRAIRTQICTINPQTSAYTGIFLQAQYATSTQAILITDTPGQGQWTNYIEGWTGGTQNLVINNAGLIFTRSDVQTATQVTAQGYGGTAQSGAFLQWNRPDTSGQGITALLTNKGGGSAGGVYIGDVNNAGTATYHVYFGASGIWFQPGRPITFATTSPLHMPSDLVNAANDAAAGAAGVAVGVMYRNGSVLMVRVT